MLGPARIPSVVLVGTCFAATCACSSDDERPPAVEDCNGVLCGNNPGGGTGSTPDAGSDAAIGDASTEDAEVSVVDLSGSVVRLIDPDFEQTLPYDGWGYLRVPTPSGDVEVPFGADAGPGFSATGVASGDGWLTVVPDAIFLDGGVSGVMPTYAYLHVPAEGATGFEVPIVERSVLSTAYAGFLQPTSVRGDAAQVIVVFERDGQREPGVTVDSHPTAEAVAFDTGTGLTTEATETGLHGVAMLVNVVGTGPLEWTAGGSESGSMTVVHVAGQASFVRIELGGT